MAPTRWLLLATVRDRTDMCLTLLRSIQAHLAGWRLMIVAQGHEYDDLKSLAGVGVAFELVHMREGVGPHRAKQAGLRDIARIEGDRGYIVCSIDDDMEFTAQTNLEPAVQRAMQPGVGFVSAGWAPHETKAAQMTLVDAFVTQPIVYTGGGMIFTARTARIIMDLPALDYYDDNTVWSLAAYLSGLKNYRYRGSLTLHRICRKGGRKGWLNRGERAHPDPAYITLRKAKTDGWCIGASSDLTALAHRAHFEARGSAA